MSLDAAGVKVPTTWAELRAAAKAVTKDGHYGVVSSGDTGGSHYIYNAILNNGGGLFYDGPQARLDECAQHRGAGDSLRHGDR
jgi:ABC-type glycerol-3-phosphate transport system substrate-binding protein